MPQDHASGATLRRLGNRWLEQPRLRTGALAAMADEIMAHADNVMQAAYAQHFSDDYWDAYVNAIITGTGIYRTPQLNAIQRAVANKIEASTASSRMMIVPGRRTGRNWNRQRLVSANEAAAAGVHRLRRPCWPAGDHVCIDIQPDGTVGPLWQMIAPSGISREWVANAMKESHDKPIWEVLLLPPGSTTGW